MRYRVKDYQIALPGGNVQKIGLTGLSGITIEDIRLIVNETKNKIICSSMKKANVTVADTVGGFSAIDVPQSVCILSTTDILTIEIDKGDVPVQGASQSSVDAIAQRLAVATAYTAEPIPTATTTETAQNHIKAVQGAVTSDPSTATNYQTHALVRIKHAATDTDNASELASLDRNMVYGGTTTSKSWQQGGQTITAQVPDSGYGFHEFWLQDGSNWIHYTASLPSAQDNINTLHPALHTTDLTTTPVTRTPTHIISLTNPN